jgi:hypothetical protein
MSIGFWHAYGTSASANQKEPQRPPMTGVPMEPIGKSSPNLRARMGGVFYILMALSGAVAGFGRRGLIVSADAASTAANIMAHQSMYLVGFGGDLLFVACYLAVTALFYRMLEPVNRTVALSAAFCSLTGCAIQGFALLFQLAPLTVLGGAGYLGVFTVEQLHALALMFLKLYTQAYAIALVFFGFYCLLTGYLIFRSTFLPRILGPFMMLAGLSGLTFLAPTFAIAYFPYTMLGAVGELLLTIWLVAKGLDSEKWKQQARAAGIPDAAQ